MEHTNLAVVERFFHELVVAKNPTNLAHYLADDFVSHTPTIVGKAGMIAFAEWLQANQPNAAEVQIDHFFAHGDVVVKHYTFASDPAEPSGRLKIVDIFRLSDGVIVEYWDVVQPLSD